MEEQNDKLKDHNIQDWQNDNPIMIDERLGENVFILGKEI
jgi:hypothetical protein